MSVPRIHENRSIDFILSRTIYRLYDDDDDDTTFISLLVVLYVQKFPIGIITISGIGESSCLAAVGN